MLAFLPEARLARGLDLLLAPTRILGELASPIGMFARREARAAERALFDAAAAEHQKSRELAQDERLFALPDEERLIRGRRFLHAQVRHRPRGTPDRLECELEDIAGPELVVDLPVVFANSYLGRVARVDADRRRIVVALATERGFRVGASLARVDPQDPPTAMVVGGVESSRSRLPPLAVHNPERPELDPGEVRVDESLNPKAPFRALSEGFVLGRLEFVGPGRPAVLPEVDFAEGLFRVVVVLPPEAAEPVPAPDVDVFADTHWRPVRAFSACEPALWREGIKIDLPRGSGAREGAAVVAGARIVGRLARAGALESDVALLGDVGLALPAIASVDGMVAPLGLGRLVSLGRESRGGALLLRWTPAQPLEPGPDGKALRAARVFSGAGELGVPRGLFVGETELPCGPGPHVLRIQQGFDPRLLHQLWVWRGIEREELERQGAP